MKNKIDDFSKKTVMVIGDLMIDRYVYGVASRISQEAPVPVVKITHEENFLGGAANAANNVVSLGGKAILIGVVGNDEDSKVFDSLAKDKKINGILIKDKSRPTTIKKRIISGNNYQLLRMDIEKTNAVSIEIENKIIAEVKKNISKINSIILSDYDKGVLTDRLAKTIIAIAKGKNIPVVVDCKPNKVNSFKNCYLITPNLKEASEMTGVKLDMLEMGRKLVKMLNCNVFLTRGSEGISVFDKKGHHSHIPPVKITKLFDVTGAGDTVIAAASLCIVSGMDLIDAAKTANYAAGLVVQKPGTAVVTPKELKSALSAEISHYLKESIEVKQKVIDSQLDKIEKAAHAFIFAYKKGNKVIAFGNGGSASDAQHLVGELVGRFKIERKGLPAVALTTDSSVVTAIANDYGYDEVFRRQVEANARKGDVVVAISTSGNSQNVINAVIEAKKIGCVVIGLIGKNGGKMAELCDIPIVVPSDNTPRIQEVHISIIHILCELLDKGLSKKN